MPSPAPPAASGPCWPCSRAVAAVPPAGIHPLAPGQHRADGRTADAASRPIPDSSRRVAGLMSSCMGLQHEGVGVAWVGWHLGASGLRECSSWPAECSGPGGAAQDHQPIDAADPRWQVLVERMPAAEPLRDVMANLPVAANWRPRNPRSGRGCQRCRCCRIPKCPAAMAGWGPCARQRSAAASEADERWRASRAWRRGASGPW